MAPMGLRSAGVNNDHRGPFILTTKGLLTGGTVVFGQISSETFHVGCECQGKRDKERDTFRPHLHYQGQADLLLDL